MQMGYKAGVFYPVFLGERDRYGTPFGGTVLAWTDGRASAATRQAKREVVAVHANAVEFEVKAMRLTLDERGRLVPVPPLEV